MRENCTYGSMRGSRRKTAKSVLRVVEDRADVPCGGVSPYSTHSVPVRAKALRTKWYNCRDMSNLVELKFPVVAHHRLILLRQGCGGQVCDAEKLNAAFSVFELVEPVAESRASAGGKYVSYSLSVRLKDREEMARFDAAIAGVPGLKTCL